MKSQVSPAVTVSVIAVVVVIVAVVGWSVLGSKTLGSKPVNGAVPSGGAQLGQGAPPLSKTGAPMSGGRYMSGGPMSPGAR